jgi:two-component system NarL family response regulator
MNIIIVDDHQMFCQGIKALLEQQCHHVVLTLVNDSHAVMPAIKKFKPELVLMDYNLGKGNGLVETQKILKFNPNIKVVMISLHQKPTLIQEAFEMGVSAYICKDADAKVIIKVIDHLQTHQCYLSPQQESMVNGTTEASPKDLLTKREKQIMLMLVQGWTNKLIAQDLEISVKTIEYHRSNILNKLSQKSLVDLTRFAIKQGWSHE